MLPDTDVETRFRLQAFQIVPILRLCLFCWFTSSGTVRTQSFWHYMTLLVGRGRCSLFRLTIDSQLIGLTAMESCWAVNWRMKLWPEKLGHWAQNAEPVLENSLLRGITITVYLWKNQQPRGDEWTFKSVTATLSIIQHGQLEYAVIVSWR